VEGVEQARGRYNVAVPRGAALHRRRHHARLGRPVEANLQVVVTSGLPARRSSNLL